jgi:predicted nuclease of predicted toxin-antitoxin system
MRFLADMGISPETLAFLRALDHDAVHLADEQLYRLPDTEVLDKATAEQRTVLTADLDFGALMALSGRRLPSVVTFRLTDMRPANVNRHLRAVVESHADDIEAGALITVSGHRARVRRLPVSVGAS